MFLFAEGSRTFGGFLIFSPILIIMFRIIISLFTCYLFALPIDAQNTYADYGRYVYDLVLSGNRELVYEFVDLNEYTAYIDRLDKLPEEIKEEIKFDATRSYTDVRKGFEEECIRILDLYTNSVKSGATFEYSVTEFEPGKNFPDIGFITCYYIVNLPDAEEPEEDAIRFECILTKNGWRILDGFFNATNL